MTRLIADGAAAMRPELLAWAFASMRVLPVTLLCPVLGGSWCPRRCGSRWRARSGSL